MRKKLLKIVLHIFGVILFIFATAYALLAAYGYQIDLMNQNLVKTSIIDIASKLKNVEIYVDDKLVSRKAPYQIKNIKPGFHKLDINKENFTKWSKKIEVIEDLVTIIDDILLLPFDYEPYLYNIKIDFDYNEYLIGDEYIIFISRDLNKLLFYKIINEELKQVGKVNIILGKKEIYFIENNRLGIKDKDSLLIINLHDSTTQLIQIPNEFNSFKLAYTPNLSGYYLNSGVIYKTIIAEDSSFNNIEILDDKQNCKYEFNIISSYDHVFLTCDNKLFEIINNRIEVIDDLISIEPEISKNNAKLIYMNTSGEVIVYNIYERTKEIVAKFVEDVDLIQWNNDSKHIFIQKNNILMICDLDFTNCNNFFDKNIYLNKSKPEYLYLNNGTLAVYDLKEFF
jgi:hypothetical protein